MRFKRIISVVVLCLLVPLSCISGQDPCPDEYGFAFQHSCYKFVNLTENRNNAARTCALEEAHLVDIKFAEEQQFIVNWLQDIDADATWIGLSRQGTDEYVWTDGSPLEYSAWALDAPNNNNACVRLKSNNYRWNDVPCDREHPYICEIEAIGCPPGWHFYNEFCYFIDNEMSTYNQAQLACIDKNATLSSVNNQNEQYIHNRFATFYVNLWIGLNRVNEGSWQWEDESTYNFTNWAPGEPNDFLFGNEDCVHLWERNSDYSGQWNDENCDTKYGYICKMYLAIPAPTTTAPTTTAMTTSSPERTSNPQSGGLSPGAIAGAVIGSILLLVLILLILFLIASRQRHKTPTKSGKSAALAFDEPYDLTIEGKSNSVHNNTKQPIYTDAVDDNNQQPIYADPTSTKPATNVYHSIVESSTDENTALVHVDIDSNNDAPNPNKVLVTGENGSGQETSLYYAKSDSHQDTSGAPNTAEQESCQEGSLYYAKSDSHPATNGDLRQESNAANTSAGWEDNAAYSTFEDGERVHNQDDVGDRQEQEGWEDNSIYAGSDPE